MKILYFQDTDTLYIEFKVQEDVETIDLDENTLIDLDRQGNFCSVTIEHASDIIVTGDQNNGEFNRTHHR